MYLLVIFFFSVFVSTFLCCFCIITSCSAIVGTITVLQHTYLDVLCDHEGFHSPLPVSSVCSTEHWAQQWRPSVWWAHSLISKHTETYTLFPTGSRFQCHVINQSCQTDFTAPSEKEERQPPNNLEKMEKIRSSFITYYQTWNLQLKNLWIKRYYIVW